MMCHYNKYKELSEKYGIPMNIIERICDSQFAFCKKIISSPGDNPVRLQNLGLFSVKPGARANLQMRRDCMKKINDEKRNKQKK